MFRTSKTQGRFFPAWGENATSLSISLVLVRFCVCAWDSFGAIGARSAGGNGRGSQWSGHRRGHHNGEEPRHRRCHNDGVDERGCVPVSGASARNLRRDGICAGVQERCADGSCGANPKRQRVEHYSSSWDTNRKHHSRCRSEEHTSELQSPCNLVCRLLLEKKKKK